MAVVAEYKLKNCTVSIHDDAYAGITEEENERRIREIQRTAWRIWDAQWARKAAEEKGKEAMTNG